MDIAGSPLTAKPVVRYRIGDDLIDPVFESVLILLNKLQHVGGHRHPRMHRVDLQGRVGLIQLDHIPVLQHDTNLRTSVDLKCPELEGLHIALRQDWARAQQYYEPDNRRHESHESSSPL